MNIDLFSDAQRLALLDLMVLAMYADSNLTLAETSCVQRLLTLMGQTTDYDRQKQFDAAITRVRRRAGNAAANTVYAAELAAEFKSSEARGKVCDLISELMASDHQVAPAEAHFLKQLKQQFQS